MIAVSSHKPFDKSFEAAQNQVRAKQSWEPIFERIIYFGIPEPMLASPKTSFIACDDYPAIEMLADECSRHPGWSAIVNADIWLSPRMIGLEPKLNSSGIRAALSRRYQIEEGKPLQQASIVDWGLDIFLAKQSVWKAAAAIVPKAMRIGHNLWDTWMISFFMKVAGRACADLTPIRLVYHPRHGARMQPHAAEVAHLEADPYVRSVTWPSRLVKL